MIFHKTTVFYCIFVVFVYWKNIKFVLCASKHSCNDFILISSSLYQLLLIGIDFMLNKRMFHTEDMHRLCAQYNQAYDAVT